jgi:dimethylargininase
MHALCRAVSPAIADCKLSFIGREAIDAALAQAQHLDYISALTRLGVSVTELPAEPDLPDSVFVEDTVLLFDELAVLTRPGAESRRAEVDAIAPAVQAVRKQVERISVPSTIDGGDVLRIGKRVFVGLSQRSNQSAIDQLADILKPFGYSVTAVPMQDCLHLKSAVTALSDDTVLINPDWVDAAYFKEYQQIRVDEHEPHAANVVRIDTSILMPLSFPKTQAIVEAAGYAVTAVDVSELQKAEGAVTCCSVLFTQWAI